LNISSPLAFCPVCGKELRERFVDEEERDRLVCVDCGHIYYQNPKIVAGTIPVKDASVWLLRRAIEPRRGFWTFPAGFMEMGETVEEAAIRETLEELNMQVELDGLVGIYSRPEMMTVHIIYQARAVSEPAGGKESLEFRLFVPGEIPWGELAFWTTRRALEDWANGMGARS
jgi:ADP-ribose pyrophosphatase YjhB (NUDIX family)